MKLKARSTHKHGPRQREARAYWWKLCLIERGVAHARFMAYVVSQAHSRFPLLSRW